MSENKRPHQRAHPVERGDFVSCYDAREADSIFESLELQITGLRKTLGEIVEMKRIERGITESVLDMMAFPMRRREIVWFTPDEIQSALDKDLAAGLRQLADAIEGGGIDGKLIDCRANGFTAKGDDRAHLLLRIDLAAPIRQVQEGESREEFERDRMGQTGEDNARKMFGK